MINLQNFLTLGGYTYYVYSAYGISLSLLGIMGCYSFLRLRRLNRSLKQHESNS